MGRFQIPNPKSQIPNPKSDDWPTYRRDIRRSGYINCSVPAKLDTLWRTASLGRLAPLVSAGGRVYAVAKEAHAVIALDLASGKKLSMTVMNKKNTPVVRPEASAEKNPTIQGGQPPGDDVRRPDDASHSSKPILFTKTPAKPGRGFFHYLQHKIQLARSKFAGEKNRPAAYLSFVAALIGHPSQAVGPPGMSMRGLALSISVIGENTLMMAW